VSIHPFLDSPQIPTILTEQAAKLASLLNSRDIKESDLLHFLANITPAVFPEADPSEKPNIGHGYFEFGVDLIFRVAGSERIGVVEIKTPKLGIRRALEHVGEDIGHVLRHPVLFNSTKVMYLIAGRKCDFPFERLSDVRQIQDLPFPLRLLSWDDVVDRLSGQGEDQIEPEFSVVLIEIVNMSRRLLRALFSEPKLLFGIDDRTFEELIATLLFDLGLEEVVLTPPRQDGGRDIIVSHTDIKQGDRYIYLIECKHWVSGNKVTSDLASEVGDLWSFGNPVQREKPDVKKVRFFVVGFRNNPLAWGKFAVYTNGTLYKGPQNTWAGYQSPGSEYYTLTSNPITGNPWTLEEIDALLAGEYHFDSGIPSRVGSYWYYLSVVYENASVRTDRATGYSGTGVMLHGTVTNTEGTFLDPYTPLGDNLLRVRFEWGETMGYGNNTAYQMGITGAFSANLAGLNPVKTYHYRAIVEVRADSRIGGFDVYYGEDMGFPSSGGPVGRSIADRLAAEGAI